MFCSSRCSRNTKPWLFGLALFWVSSSALLLGQGGSNRINGQVTDPSGAIIIGATITAHEVSTNVETTTKSNDGGYYLLQLPVGTYEIRVANPGFQTAIQERVPVEVGSNNSVNFMLQVGSPDQRVEVHAEATLLSVDSSTVQTTAESKLVMNMPLAFSGRERNAATFLSMVPGYQGNRLNGGQGGEQSITVDGATVSPASFATGLQTQMIVPSFAVQEFQVVSNALEAQDGRTSNGAIKYALKSGTNSLHGSAFEYLRNKALDARNFFSPVVTQDTQHEFGFELGGPIIIPKLYNGKDRTFFYMYYDGFRFVNTSPTTNTLLTKAMKDGNFSAAGIPALFDPGSTQPSGTGGFTRLPFPGNQIPKNRMSSISSFFASQFPDPNGSGLANNNIGVTRQNTNDDQGMIKIDQALHNGRISISDSDYRAFTNTVGPFGQDLSGTINDNHGHRAILNWDTVIKPTLLNHFGASFNRWLLQSFYQGQQTFTSGNDLNKKAGLAQGVVGGSGSARITVGGGYYLSGNQGSAINRIAHANWRLSDDLTWHRGSHTFQFGASMDRYSTTGVQLSGGRTYLGNYTFAPQETGMPGVQSTGFAAASFLVGEVDTATWGQQPSQAWLFRPWGVYAQDSWKIRPNLTINYGLRWEYERPIRDKQDRIANFDPTLANPGAGNLLGALVFAGNGTGRAGVHQFANPWRLGFGPRIGLAYNFRPKTVVRAGFTVNYDGNAGPAIFLNQQGFFSQATVSTLDSGVTPAFNWAIGFPNVQLGPYFDKTFANGTSTSYMQPNGARLPIILNWNIGLQQMLPGNSMLDISYVGLSSHHHLSGALDYNQLNPKYLALGSALNAQIGSAAANSAGIAAPYPGFRGSVAQALRPYPQYQNITLSSNPIGNNTYNALQVSLRKRYSNGLTVLMSYVYSKNLTDVEGSYGGSLGAAQNFYSISLEKSVQSTDTPHAFVSSYTYELPFGDGKRFHSGSKIVDRYLLGGWTTSGQWTLRAGTPLGVTTQLTLPGKVGNLRANVVNDQVYAVNDRGTFDPAKDVYVNSKAFALPAAFTFGNAPRLLSQLRTFGVIQWNVGLLKSIPITERVHLLIRPEFFNVLNTTNFGSPATDLNSLAFGKITTAGSPRNGQISATLAW